MMKQLLIAVFLLLAATVLSAQEKPVFYFFHSEVCPHCIEAAPFIAFLKEKYPQIEFRELEVYRDLVNREILKKKAQELGVTKVGVPFFLIGKQYLSGFKKGEFEEKIILLIEDFLATTKKDTTPPAAAVTQPAPVIVPPPVVAPLTDRTLVLQKEAHAIEGDTAVCYEDPAQIGDCLKKIQQRLGELMTVIVGQTAEQLDRIRKAGKLAIQTKAAYLDQQALWKKQCNAEALLDEAICRAGGKQNCDGLSVYLSIQNGQSRIQKLLSDLQMLQEISPGI